MASENSRFSKCHHVPQNMVTFCLPVKQQEVCEGQSAETPTHFKNAVSQRKRGNPAPKEEANHIASEHYHGGTGRILNTVACSCNTDKLVTSFYLYFPTSNIHVILNFVRVWSGYSVTQEGHAIFWTFGLFGQQ